MMHNIYIYMHYIYIYIYAYMYAYICLYVMTCMLTFGSCGTCCYMFRVKKHQLHPSIGNHPVNE